MRRWVAAWVLAALALGATPGMAQKSSACLDSLPPTVFNRVPVHLVGSFVLPENAVGNGVALLTEIIAEQMRRGLGATGDTLPRGDSLAHWRRWMGSAKVFHQKDGSFTWSLDTEDTSRGTLRLLGSALAAARQAGELLPWDDRLAADSVVYRLTFAWPTVSRTGTVTPIEALAASPVFSLPAPWEQGVAQTSSRGPAYPLWPRQQSLAATIHVQYVVDSTGRVEMASFKDLWPEGLPRLEGKMEAHYQEFVTSIRNWARSARFTPAEIGGCKVNQLVRQPFNFNIR